MSKEIALIKSSKRSCVEARHVTDGLLLLLQSQIKNNDTDFLRTTNEIRDKMIKDAIEMYEQKVRDEKPASPRKSNL